jgi:hypothetical protein
MAFLGSDRRYLYLPSVFHVASDDGLNAIGVVAQYEDQRLRLASGSGVVDGLGVGAWFPSPLARRWGCGCG